MQSMSEGFGLKRVMALVAVLALVMVACTGEEPTTTGADATEGTETTAATETTAGAAETTAGAETTGGDTTSAPATTGGDGEAGGREDTVIVEAFRPLDAEIANPYIDSSDALVSDGVHQLILEPLFYANYATGELEPWLATGFEYNEDNTVITVNLREGVTWADGEPFTADDVVFTMEQILAAEAPFRAANIQASVESATAVDPLTVEITLTDSNPRFVQTDLAYFIYTANFVPLPQHIFEGEDFETFAFFNLQEGLPIGTGPYTVESINPERSVLTRNDTWWAAETGFAELPAPQQVIFSLPGPEDSIISELQSNDIDWAGHYGLTASGTEVAMGQNDALQTIQYFDPCPWALTVNTAAAPWDDPEMRWALSYSLHKDLFSSLFNQPAEPTPARSTFPEYGPLTEMLDANADLFEEFDTLAYDPEQAASILESKGYTNQGGQWVDADGAPLTVRLSIFNAAAMGGVWTNAEQLLIQDLEDAGFTVESTPGDFGPIVDARINGDYDIQSWFECGSISDPWSTLNRYAGEAGSDNPSMWNNDEYNEIVVEIGRLTPGDPQIEELSRDALEIFLRELPVIPMAQRPEPLVMNTTYWTGWPTDEDRYTIPAAWGMTFHQMVTRIQPAE